MADDDEPLDLVEAEAEASKESPEKILAGIRAKSAELDKLLQQAQVTDAWKLALKNAPVNTTDQDCKAANWALVQRALLATKDIDALLAALGPSDYDVLMKYLYRGLGTGERATCERCLLIHEKLVEKANIGCIMRALTDVRHTV